MLNIGINTFPATCCRPQSAASLHLCWARNVAELMRPAGASWLANECTLLNLPLWLPSNHNVSSFVIFPRLCVFVRMCLSMGKQQEKGDTGPKRDIDGMGVPEIKYGDSVCFVMHMATGLWLSYQAPDAKSSRLGPLKRRVNGIKFFLQNLPESFGTYALLSHYRTYILQHHSGTYILFNHSRTNISLNHSGTYISLNHSGTSNFGNCD